MEFWVLMKQTFDTEEKMVIKDGIIEDSGVKFIINPYDEYAIEEAVRLRETVGGRVTVVTVGPERTESALRTALAMGADQAVRIDTGVNAAEGSFFSAALAALIRQRPFDLILGGNFAVDSGAGEVAIRLAEMLDLPHIGSVTRLEVHDDRITAARDAEGDSEIVTCPLPALVTAQQGLNEPRYPSLPGIMKARRKPIECLTTEDLGLNGLKEKTAVIDTFLPPPKKAGRMLEGDPDHQVDELVKILGGRLNLSS